MKQQPEYLETCLWYKEKITDPYQAICNKKNPGDLLYDFKILESVVNATYLTNKEKRKGRSGSERTTPLIKPILRMACWHD